MKVGDFITFNDYPAIITKIDESGWAHLNIFTEHGVSLQNIPAANIPSAVPEAEVEAEAAPIAEVDVMADPLPPLNVKGGKGKGKGKG